MEIHKEENCKNFIKLLMFQYSEYSTTKMVIKLASQTCYHDCIFEISFEHS